MNISDTDGCAPAAANVGRCANKCSGQLPDTGDRMIVVRQHEVVSHRRRHRVPPVASVDYRGEETVHVIGFWQFIMGDVLQLSVPRAVCGERLAGGPDQADPAHLGAPMCAVCAERAGSGARRQVPAYVMRALADAGSAP